MNPRERFLAIMHYAPFDRLPALHWDVWPETRERWITEGLPENADLFAFFGAEPRWIGVHLDLGLVPPFEEQVLEEGPAWRVKRCRDVVTRKEWKVSSGLPQSLEFTLRGAEDWPAYRERLQPDPRRIPSDLGARLATARSSGLPVALHLGSLVGVIRDWMGVENLVYLCRDAPGVFEEMVETLAALARFAADVAAPLLGRPFDLGVLWEDICFRNGPLVDPGIFRRVVTPRYARIREKLEAAGTHLLAVDCDGLIEPLLGSWLEGGVNLLYPVEIGTWHAEPVVLRRMFGRTLRMIGGVDKRALAQGPGAIDAELDRRASLARAGGYIPMPDHHIPPDTPLAHYRYYLERVRLCGGA